MVTCSRSTQTGERTHIQWANSPLVSIVWRWVGCGDENQVSNCVQVVDGEKLDCLWGRVPDGLGLALAPAVLPCRRPRTSAGADAFPSTSQANVKPTSTQEARSTRRSNVTPTFKRHARAQVHEPGPAQHTKFACFARSGHLSRGSINRHAVETSAAVQGARIQAQGGCRCREGCHGASHGRCGARCEVSLPAVCGLRSSC